MIPQNFPLYVSDIFEILVPDPSPATSRELSVLLHSVESTRNTFFNNYSSLTESSCPLQVGRDAPPCIKAERQVTRKIEVLLDKKKSIESQLGEYIKTRHDLHKGCEILFILLIDSVQNNLRIQDLQDLFDENERYITLFNSKLESIEKKLCTLRTSQKKLQEISQSINTRPDEKKDERHY